MAQGVELFQLLAKLVLDTEGFDNGIDGAKKKANGFFSGAESGVTKVSSAMNVMGKVGGVVVDVVKGIASAGVGLAETAANMEAMEQSYTEAFKGIEKEAEAAFTRVGEANNVAQLRLQESGIAFFRQFTSAGMDSNQAVEMMEKSLGFAADAAAAYNISLEDASSMMRSFMRGNVEAGESIGLFVNQVTREDLAGTLFDGKKWADLTEEQRQFALAMHVGNTYSLSNVLGQGAREMNNWSNVLGNLSSAWTKAQGIMGEEIMVALIPALQDLTAWIEENPQVFQSLGEIFGEVAVALVGAFQSLLEFVEKNGDKIQQFFDGLANVFSGNMSFWDFLAGRWQKKDPEVSIGSGNVWGYLQEHGFSPDTMLDAFGNNYEAANVYADLFAQSGLSVDEITPELSAQWEAQALSGLQQQLDEAGFTANVSFDFAMPTDVMGWLSNFTPHARGLEYVPTDGYPALLHRGESVLNRVEAEHWRAAQRGGMMGFDPAALGAAVAAALAGVTVNIDGHTAGALLTPYVSKEQYKETWKRR